MRFINADDPNIIQMGSAEKQELNLYAYCVNDPVNCVDPSGYIAFSVIAGGIGGALMSAVTYRLEYLLGMRRWSGWAFAGYILLGAALGAAGGFARSWIKFANLARLASRLKITQPVLKFILSLATRGLAFAINAIAKKFTRKPGESWPNLIFRLLGWR